VTGDLSFQSISTGSSHTCGVTTDGSAYCWGNNQGGKLGDGTAQTRVAPTRVATMEKFSAISAGASLSCGIATGGVAYCWGEGMYGQVGNGGFGDSHLPARVVR
jgi:alpha-tubulin suppressor-like RCC1 family protein